MRLIVAGPRWMRPLATILAFLLAVQNLPLFAQEQSTPKLNIIIVEGDGAINNIRQRTAREPIVQVEDENRRPVAGASVVFLLPDSGASAVFPDGSRVATLVTDSQGRAAARGLRPNNVAGEFQIRVSASFQGATGTATIRQTNALLAAAAAGGGISAKLIAILAVAGAAAATGAVVATRNGNGSQPAATPPPPIVITPGAPSVGGPR